MTIYEAYLQLVFQLKNIYQEREAANICDLIFENITGLKKMDRIINKNLSLNNQQDKLLQHYTNDLILHKPVQYVLNEAWFAGMKFYVDENVLIPRPETEELVNWVIEDGRKSKVVSHKTETANSLFTILDIGTGSGCIAIALKKKFPETKIFAIDISEKALDVAKKNAEQLNTDISFQQINILENEAWKHLSKFDIIVSNPPYVKQSEELNINKNVLDYEPHEALFVKDEDALIFYKAIAEFGLNHLNETGKIFFEINETMGNEVCSLLKKYNYKNIDLKKDLQGKDRMIKAAMNH